MSPTDIGIAVVVLAAAVTQGILGFGFALVVMGVLPRLLPLPSAVAFAAVCGTLVSFLVLVRYRRHVVWREIREQYGVVRLTRPHSKADYSCHYSGSDQADGQFSRCGQISPPMAETCAYRLNY